MTSGPAVGEGKVMGAEGREAEATVSEEREKRRLSIVAEAVVGKVVEGFVDFGRTRRMSSENLAATVVVLVDMMKEM